MGGLIVSSLGISPDGDARPRRLAFRHAAMGHAAVQMRLYVVDGDDAVRDSLAMLLPLAGLEVETYATGADFLAAFKRGQSVPCPPAAVLCEARLPDQNGLDVLDELERCGQHCPFALLVSNQDQAHRRLDRQIPIVTKPVVHRRVLAVTRKLLADNLAKQAASETTD